MAITASHAGFVPRPAVVYILFSNEMANGFFSHMLDRNTAGGEFTYQLNKLLADDKELKSIMKDARRKNPPDVKAKLAAQIADHYLAAVDEALMEHQTWLSKHPERAWEMTTVQPDSEGNWQAGGLRAGRYDVVIRGKVQGSDCDWEASVDVSPGATVEIPTLHPRFVSYKQPSSRTSTRSQP